MTPLGTDPLHSHIVDGTQHTGVALRDKEESAVTKRQAPDGVVREVLSR